jgi:hypothetical protein
MIHRGVDLHQAFCYMTALDSTGRSLKAGPVANDPQALRRWLRGFFEPVTVAVEACSFWPAFQEAVEEEVEQIRLVHPQRVKAIAAAKLKNDRVDSQTLAHLSRWRGNYWERPTRCCAMGCASTNRSLRRCKENSVSPLSCLSLEDLDQMGRRSSVTILMCLEHE